jgi:hypothetical protein
MLVVGLWRYLSYQTHGDDISNAELVETSKTYIDLELHLESWLEKSP